jgi:enoyl-CoA hydratase/carnithine racemase
VLQITTDHHVRTLTLDRPEARNAFSQALYRATGEALDAAAADDDVRVVVITGSPNFSAGTDLNEMARLAAGTFEGDGGGFNVLLEALERFPKPLLAAVEGAAVGIGFTMLLHVDIAIAARDARLRTPFSEMGVPPEAGSSVLLAQRIGWQAAAEVLLTSRWITGEEAVKLGLALRCAEPGHSLDDALALAAAIARQDPWATRQIKALMLFGRGDVAVAARHRESAAFAELFRARRGAQ